MVRWEDYIKAARELSPSALSLYMYLAKNQDNYEFYFSTADYCKTFNVVDKTCRNAKKELLNKGYLKEDSKTNKTYFDARGGYGETKEQLIQQLRELYNRINIKDEQRAQELKETMEQAKLKTIQVDAVYMIEIKKLIAFAEDIIKDIDSVGFDDLL